LFNIILEKWARGLRREESACADHQGDVDLIVSSDLAQSLGKVVVAILVQGAELLGVVDGNNSHAAAVLDLDDRHCGRQNVFEEGDYRVH
jgi:hypothetical protein